MNDQALQKIICVLLAQIDAMEDHLRLRRATDNEREELQKKLLAAQNEILAYRRHVVELETELKSVKQSSSAEGKTNVAIKKRGRPKGSKNRPKVAA